MDAGQAVAKKRAFAQQMGNDNFLFTSIEAPPILAKQN